MKGRGQGRHGTPRSAILVQDQGQSPLVDIVTEGLEGSDIVAVDPAPGPGRGTEPSAEGQGHLIDPGMMESPGESLGQGHIHRINMGLRSTEMDRSHPRPTEKDSSLDLILFLGRETSLQQGAVLMPTNYLLLLFQLLTRPGV